MRTLLFGLVLCLAATGQHAAFDVISIHLNKAGPQAPNGFFPSPGRLRVTNMSLEQLCQAAWRLPTGTLFGLSDWMRSDRFDLDATTQAGANFESELDMLQALLRDRFRVRFHRETRQLKMLALLPGKHGPTIHASSDPAARERIGIRPGDISGTNIPFGHFVSILQTQLGYPIANETGLSGSFDLSLRYAGDDGSDEAPVSSALEEQLGLKLETRRGPVEVFVIDSARRPDEN